MTNWKRFTQRDCPVCDGVRKDCRQNLSTNLIHCRHTEANPIDYKFIKKDTLSFGVWGYQADIDEWNQAKREEWREQREREKQAEKKRHERSLSPSERDREIRKILNQLTLSDLHRQQLKQRGFTDKQIEAANYRSVTQWQKLDFAVSNRLAGTNRSGNGLTNNNDGVLIPITDVNGFYVGFQLRKDNPDDGNKYVWLSNEAKSTKLQNGELPLAVYKPSKLSDDGVATEITFLDEPEKVYKPSKLVVVGLTEGTGFKPYRASLRLGIPTIGASGGDFSPEILKESLEQLGAELVILYPDAGSLTNPNVLNQYRKLFNLLLSWGYSVAVAWWGQFEKSDGDIDEISDEKLQAIAYLSVDEFLAKTPNKKQKQQKGIWSLKNLVEKLKTLTPRAKPIGFGKTEPTEPPLFDNQSRKYKKDERIDTWINSKAKNLLDISPTATGKSFDTGRLRPSMFNGEIDEIIYVTTDPRNVSTETLKDWPVVEGRHNGLTYNGLGELRRRKSDDQPLVVDPNCFRPKTLEVLASKNISNATDKSLICKGCPQFEKCSNGIGRYNYLGQRRETLLQSRKVMHPSSLPDPSEYDYSRTRISWEESENSFNTTKTVKAIVEDVKAVIVALSEDLELSQSFNPLLNKLKRLFDSKQPSRFGWTGQQLKDELLSLLPSEIDYDGLAALLKPDLSFLNPVAEYGENIENLPPSLKKRFSAKDQDLASKASTDVNKNWLFNFIDALTGKPGTYLSLAYGELTISFPDERLKAIARAAAKNIFLSATESPKLLESRLGESVEVIECESKKPDNITFTQVIDLGKMGQQRGQQQSSRANAIIAHYKTTRGESNVATIRFKRHSKDDPDALNHFVHSQGTNAVEGKTTLAIDGVPCPNLESLKHDYAVTTGKDPEKNTEDFERYANHRINSIIKQEIGRIRANRYPDQQFEVIFLTNHDLSWLGLVNQVTAREITPDAESKTERFKRLVSEAVNQLIESGKKVTQTAVSHLTGYSQQYISQFKKLLQMLIEFFKAKVVKNSDPLDSSSDLGFLGKNYLPLVEKNELLTEFGMVLDIYPQSDWLALWEFLPDETRVSLLAQIFALCEVAA